MPAINREGFAIVTLIRERWLQGAYTRAEIAFDIADAAPVNLEALDQRYGQRAMRFIPRSMRVSFPGRRITNDGPPLPGVIRLSAAAAPDHCNNAVASGSLAVIIGLMPGRAARLPGDAR